MKNLKIEERINTTVSQRESGKEDLICSTNVLESEDTIKSTLDIPVSPASSVGKGLDPLFGNSNFGSISLETISTI